MAAQRVSAVLALTLLASLCAWAAEAPAGSGPRPRKISLNLFSGPAFYALGDVNGSVGSYRDYFERLRSDHPEWIWTTGGLEKVDRSSWLKQVELRLNLSSRFSLGLALQPPFRMSRESSIVCREHREEGRRVTDLFLKPGIRLFLPTDLTVNYLVASISGFRFLAQAGVCILPSKLEHKMELDVHEPSGDFTRLTAEVKARPSMPVGIIAGLGFDCVFSSHLSVLLESQYRLGRFSRLRGRSRLESRSYNSADELIQSSIIVKEGALYYISRTDPAFPGTFDLDIFPDPPEGAEDGVTWARRARLDLSGFSVKVRLRIKLF